jgi:hypothetical protein
MSSTAGTKRSPQKRKEAPTPKRPRPHGGHGPDVPNIVAENTLDELPDQPFAEGAGDTIDPDLRHRMISESAYHRYAERGYEDGYDLDDWLQAEADVEHVLLNREA